MGVLSLSSLISEVRAGLGNRSDVTDQMIVDALNLAQARLSRRHDFKEMKRTAVTTNALTSDAAKDKYLKLPARLKVIHTLVLLDGDRSRKLREKPWRMVDARFPMPENLPRRRPVIYSRWGELLLLIPVPDQVYKFSMKYTRDPTPFDLNNPGQLSDFDFKDDILIAEALAWRWSKLGRHDKANEHLREARILTEDAIKQDDNRPDMNTSSWDNDEEGREVISDYWADPFVRGVYDLE